MNKALVFCTVFAVAADAQFWPLGGFGNTQFGQAIFGNITFGFKDGSQGDFQPSLGWGAYFPILIWAPISALFPPPPPPPHTPIQPPYPESASMLPRLMSTLPFSTPSNVQLTSQLDLLIESLTIVNKQDFISYSENFEKGSIQYLGSQERLYYALMNAILSKKPEGRKIRVAAVGGSITVGTLSPKSMGYASLFVQWLRSALHSINVSVTFKNAAIGGTASEYFSVCINEHLTDLNETDILLVEFAVNDANAFDHGSSGYQRLDDAGRTLEELVRVVWRRNPLVHIILVNHAFLAKLFNLGYGHGDRCESMEDVYLNVAKRYDIPSLRWRHIFCNDNGDTPLTNATDAIFARLFTEKDNFHQSKLAHLIMGDFLIYSVNSAIANFTNYLRQIASDTEVPGDVADVLIANYKDSAYQNVDRLLYKQPPVYNTTRMISTDCFASLYRPFRIDKRLFKALLSYSSTSNSSSKYSIAYQKLYVYNYGPDRQDWLGQFSLGNELPSFMEFNLTSIRMVPKFWLKKACPTNPSYYLPRLAVAYTSCKSCTKPGLLLVDTETTFSDGSVVNSTAFLELRSHNLGNTVVQYITPGDSLSDVDDQSSILSPSNSSCLNIDVAQGRIKEIRVTFTKLTESFYFDMFSIVVTFECCP